MGGRASTEHEVSSPYERASLGTRIAIIGGGKMGSAILGGWIDAQTEPASDLTPKNFIVANPGEERRAYLADRYGVECVADARDIEGADIVVLAVKPQVMHDVLSSISQTPAYWEPSSPLFVSIAAGLTTEALLEDLANAGADSDSPAMPPRLVRVMPNMPLLVGEGTTAVCASRTSADEDVMIVRDLFACLGSAYVVAEEDMDAICALSGSGPAYVAAVIEALRDAGVACGLDESLAESLAFDTMYGTCCLMRQTDCSPEDLRLSVCSPGGTTLAALSAMDEEGFAQVFLRGVSAAVKRSKELASC